MKGTFALLLLILLLFGPVRPGAAHQPRIITGQTVEIKNPEVSQAYYADLQRRPDQYKITAASEFNLYVSLLVPDLPDIRKDYLVEVFQVGAGGQLLPLFELDGKGHSWEPFYEPFAGDSYLQGPEHEEVVPAGDYEIRVSNLDNEGKYVLSVGREERFTLSEGMDTIRRLPAFKRYFGKSPWTAYFNLVGLFMLLAVLAVVAVVFGAYRLINLARK